MGGDIKSRMNEISVKRRRGVGVGGEGEKAKWLPRPVAA